MDITDLENRFKFHPAMSQATKDSHERVRNWCLDLACYLNSEVPDGREKSLAITHLEEIMYWANAAIARR